MIFMVSTFGAPVIEAEGKERGQDLGQGTLGLGFDRRGHLQHGRVGLDLEELRVVSTLPGRAIRPRSFRTMSTIITFSARFLADERSSGGADRRRPGRGPARGSLHRPANELVAIEPEEELGRKRATTWSPMSRKAAYRVGMPIRPSPERTPRGRGLETGLETPGEVDLIGVALCDSVADSIDRHAVAGAVDRGCQSSAGAPERRAGRAISARADLRRARTRAAESSARTIRTPGRRRERPRRPENRRRRDHLGRLFDFAERRQHLGWLAGSRRSDSRTFASLESALQPDRCNHVLGGVDVTGGSYVAIAVLASGRS